MKEIVWLNLGLVPYQAAWDLQKFLVDQKKTAPLSPDFLILLEHPPVLTLGRWGRLENVLVDRHRLRELQIDLVRCERGGQVTYHGPGQLVGYPVLNLKSSRVRDPGLCFFTGRGNHSCPGGLRPPGRPKSRVPRRLGGRGKNCLSGPGSARGYCLSRLCPELRRRSGSFPLDCPLRVVRGSNDLPGTVEGRNNRSEGSSPAIGRPF